MVTNPVFVWLAGHAVLDFTNTVTWRRWGLDLERLQSYADLLRWSQQARILDAAAVVSLERAARDRPRAASAVYHDAIRVRSELHDLFVAQATGKRPPANVIHLLNGRIRRMLPHVALRAVGDRVTVGWSDDSRFDRPIWPIVKATVDLLASSEFHRLRLCANPDCGWVFLDHSRKGNRRWCSMRECGSRAKARAYYQRRQAKAVRHRSRARA